jgi:hypothetical protein
MLRMKPRELDVANRDRRPKPSPQGAEIPKITDQRLGRASLTRGNVAGSHTPGNITPETRLPGSSTQSQRQQRWRAWRTASIADLPGL